MISHAQQVHHRHKILLKFSLPLVNAYSLDAMGYRILSSDYVLSAIFNDVHPPPFQISTPLPSPLAECCHQIAIKPSSTKAPSKSSCCKCRMYTYIILWVIARTFFSFFTVATVTFKPITCVIRNSFVPSLYIRVYISVSASRVRPRGNC